MVRGWRAVRACQTWICEIDHGARASEEDLHHIEEETQPQPRSSAGGSGKVFTQEGSMVLIIQLTDDVGNDEKSQYTLYM